MTTNKTVFVHLPASTTIGIASEILRLALARAVLFKEIVVPTRVGWPRLLKSASYPSAIYRVLVAPRLEQGRGWSFACAKISVFFAQVLESVVTRMRGGHRAKIHVPSGQEGLYLDSPELYGNVPGGGTGLAQLRRIAHAIRGFGPVTLNEEATHACAANLGEMGVYPKDWFVCLHVRTSAFHKDQADYRNASFDNYLLAIEHIISLGGKVVRLGDAGQGIIPFPMPGLIDYPNTRWKSEVMDLYLIKQCRFYIGTLSGILDTAYLLQTPTLCVNSLHFDMRSANPCDRMLYKHVRRKGRNRSLTFAEALDSYHDILAEDWYQRYEFDENSGDEILAATREFISVIEESKRVTPRQVKARRILVRKRLRYAAEHGGAYSMLAASIAFSRCHIVDQSLAGWDPM